VTEHVDELLNKSPHFFPARRLRDIILSKRPAQERTVTTTTTTTTTKAEKVLTSTADQNDAKQSGNKPCPPMPHEKKPSQVLTVQASPSLGKIELYSSAPAVDSKNVEHKKNNKIDAGWNSLQVGYWFGVIGNEFEKYTFSVCIFFIIIFCI